MRNELRMTTGRVGDVVIADDLCAVCTHPRTEQLRGRLACSDVIEVDCRAPGA